MLKFLFKWWDSANRSSDMTILWPICKQHAPSLDDAKAAFYMHIINDPAWTNHYVEADLIDFVDRLQ